MDQVRTIQALVGQKSRVQWVRGLYRGLDGLRVIVDFDGGEVPAHPATSYRPAINEPVWVCITDDVAYMVGPTRPLPADGVVESTASGKVTLSTDIGTVVASYPLGATLSAGQEVKLFWGGELPHVIGVKSTTPAPPPASGGGGGVASEHTKTFTAVQAGSYGSSWWTDQVWSSDNNLGAWFYGTKIRDTIPAGAQIRSVQVFLSPTQLFGDPANFTIHGHAYQPSGSPALYSSALTAPSGGWVGLPVSFGNALRAGGGALGIGIAHGGFHIFRSLAQDALSGALHIRFRA